MSMNYVSPDKLPEELGKLMAEQFELANTGEKIMDEEIKTVSRGFFKDAMFRLKRNKAAIAAFWIICLMVVMAIFGPNMNEFTFSEQHPDFTNMPPRIPVLEDEYCEISVNRTDGDYISGWGFGSANTGDRFAMGTMSAVTREAAYFFFDAHSDSGKLVDLSLLPDGFGVYRLPFTDISLEGVTGSGRVVKCVDVHELEMICPLDPNIRLRDLTIDYQLEQLMVHSIEEETYYITFVDMATGAVLQKLPVMAAEEGVVSRYQFDAFWVLVNHFTNEVAVVTADGAGGHKVALLTGGMPEANDGAFLYPDIMAFDGQRLVMGSPEFGARWSGTDSTLRAWTSISLPPPKWPWPRRGICTTS